jgi:hypothetical protein
VMLKSERAACRTVIRKIPVIKLNEPLVGIHYPFTQEGCPWPNWQRS